MQLYLVKQISKPINKTNVKYKLNFLMSNVFQPSNKLKNTWVTHLRWCRVLNQSKSDKYQLDQRSHMCNQSKSDEYQLDGQFLKLDQTQKLCFNHHFQLLSLVNVFAMEPNAFCTFSPLFHSFLTDSGSLSPCIAGLLSSAATKHTLKPIPSRGRNERSSSLSRTFDLIYVRFGSARLVYYTGQIQAF